MRRVVLLAALFGLLALAVPALAEAQVVAHISPSTQPMKVSVDGVDGEARLPDTDRHVQADRAVPLSRLDHL